MSRIKEFCLGKVDFVVTDLPVNCINKLRTCQIYNISLHEKKLAFSAPLVNAVTVKQMITNFDWQMQENFNLIRGINFLLKRFMLSIAIILALIAFLVTDMGIYQVKVISSNSALTAAVDAYLPTVGIKKFMRKRQVAANDLATKLVATFPNVAHANVRIAGNTLLIYLSPAAYQENQTKINYYARYDAVVKEVMARSGLALVSPGDVVKQGDLLVQDAYPDTVIVVGEVAFEQADQIVRLDILIN